MLQASPERPEVILTADRGSFTDYGGSSVLGYVACMPARLVPRFFMDRLFTPPIKSDRYGRALTAPYALRKLETLLIRSGFSTWMTPPRPKKGGVSMLGSRVLALWWGFNASIPKIVGLGVLFGVSPLGTSGHANGVPIRGINPQTIKEITSSRHRCIPRKLKNTNIPRPKGRGLPCCQGKFESRHREG